MTGGPFQQTEAGARVEFADHWTVEAPGVRVGVQAWRHRLLPWLHTCRVPRFGRGLAPAVIHEALGALAGMARDRPVLRLSVEAWSEDPAQLRLIGDTATGLGYEAAVTKRSYSRTIWLDLSPAEDELLAGFSPTCRRHIRAPGKRGYRVEAITDPAAAKALREIFRESFRRTGGQAPRLDWDELVRLGAAAAAPVRLVGLFPPEAGGDSPIAFAVAYLHGDVAEYAHAGSLRHPDHHLPLLYAPTWDLMRWAKRSGAKCWDFGGVREPSAGPDVDASGLAGIGAFKAAFSGATVHVGEEWVLEPRAVATAIVGSARTDPR